MANLFEFVRKHLLNEVMIRTKICHKNVAVTKSDQYTWEKCYSK